jgi:ketosteroid isomerase-like protein
MRTRALVIPVVVLVIAVLAACAPAASTAVDHNPAPAAPTAAASNPAPTVQAQSMTSSGDAISVVKAYMDTANTADFDKTLAFYTDDAVVYNPLGVFVGKAEISKWLTNDVKTTRVTPADVQMQGSMVVVTGTVSLDRFQKAGVGDVAFSADYMVKDGKIRFFSPTIKLTPDQQAKMKAAQANAPAVPTPQVNPEDVAKGYVDAANSGDFNKALSFYADNAAALVMNNALLLSGKDQISKWLKSDVQTTHATAQNWQANGNVVTNTGTVSLARFTKLGISQVQYQSLYVIENGKIRLFWPIVMLTPDQQAIVQVAQPAPTKAP